MANLSLFDAYEEEFKQLIADESSREIKQLEDLIKQMNLEMRSLVSSDESLRQPLALRIHKSKSLLASYQLEMDKLALTQNRGCDSTQQQQLMDKISQQNNAILNAHKSIAESEAIGGDIIQELGRNRGKIESSQAKASEFKGEVDSATQRLKSMSDREKCSIS